MSPDTLRGHSATIPSRTLLLGAVHDGGGDMRQLGGQDASCIYNEAPRMPQHIGSFAIYDPTTAPGGKVTFKGILDHIRTRMMAAPSTYERLVRVPFDYDHPYWVPDPEFDLEFHVRHIALPQPGDWRQLCIQVARLHG